MKVVGHNETETMFSRMPEYIVLLQSRINVDLLIGENEFRDMMRRVGYNAKT